MNNTNKGKTINRTSFHRGFKTTTDMAKRLEMVRWENRCASLTEFWEKLREVPGCSVTYAAARTYHTGPCREPSVAYLAAVVRRFKVDACWLLTGGFDA